MADTPETGFRCATCGEWHGDLPTDLGFQLPDDVWAIDPPERDRRAEYDDDLCVLDERRHFIRGVLMVPFADQDDYFGWGLWVEVSRRNFVHYQKLFACDGTHEPPFDAVIANRLKSYPSAYRKPVKVQLGTETKRPSFSFQGSARHLLSVEQRHGIDAARHHEVLRIQMPGRFGPAERDR